MNESQPVSERIRHFVLEKFPLARKRGLKDGDGLLESGIVDSMGVLEIVSFVEQEFGFQISDEELVPDNFKTIEHLSAFVNARKIVDSSALAPKSMK